MGIALYNRVFDEDDVDVIEHLLDGMKERQITPVIFEGMVPSLKKFNILPDNYDTFSSKEPLSSNIKCLFSLGGDGTILDTVTHIKDLPIPVLGINLGRLGFLAGTGTSEVDMALDAISNDKYILDPRSLIHLDSSVPLFDQPFGLNEFSIHRSNSSSLMVIHTYINGDFLCSYWADGIIVATPTGSTGYSLSCGGPIIFPQADNFVITPVAPHNLNVRPVVISQRNIISFEIEGRAEQFMCSLDSRSVPITQEVSLAVRKEKFKINMVRLEGQNFLKTLRTKMYWGMDRRN